MSRPKKLHTAVNSDGELGQVYHIPMKYAQNFRLFTVGGVHQYSNTDAELREQLEERGFSAEDFEHYSPVKLSVEQSLENGFTEILKRIPDTQDDSEKDA